MAQIPPHNWTPEKLREKSLADIRDLRGRAMKFGAIDLIAMCDDALAEREEKAKRPRNVSTARRTKDRFVSEYHFVCEKDRGVIEVGGGQFWSGSWVVDEENVQASLQHGDYLALHESRASDSYRQGKIIEYRISSRDVIQKANKGIEFLVEETYQSLPWVGTATGEKGYKWLGMAGLESRDDARSK